MTVAGGDIIYLHESRAISFTFSITSLQL